MNSQPNTTPNAVLRQAEGGRLTFRCPGCGDTHTVNGSWTWNGDVVRPTLSPSVLVTSGHYCQSHQPGDDCYCTLRAKEPDTNWPEGCYRCHSFVRDGQIEFLSDCTHALAGQTVPLKAF